MLPATRPLTRTFYDPTVITAGKERRSKGNFGLESTEDAYPRKSDISSASRDPSAEDIKSRKQTNKKNRGLLEIF